jgi:cell division septation protein DedD
MGLINEWSETATVLARAWLSKRGNEGLLTFIKRSGIVFTLALFLAGGGVLCAQNTSMQLGTEIQNIEQRLSIAGISSAERHDALVRLAQLRQLSGNIATAADNWFEAAAADPDDDTARVSGAYCLAAIGEWEKAASALLPLLASGKGGPSTLQAHFLSAFLKIRNSSDASTLAAFAEDSEFVSLRPMIYYTLWQTITRNPDISGAADAETWKSRLLAEFPQSPEARAGYANKQKDAPSISAIQSPLWLLLPGTGFSTVAKVTPATPPATITPTVPTPAPSPPVTAKPVTPMPPPAVSAVVLQTGLFSKEANARTHIEALRKAGFSASMSRKLVNGTEHWAVTVPTGQDSKKTTADLKKAGFDSFPVQL